MDSSDKPVLVTGAGAYRSARWFCGKTSVRTHYVRTASMSLWAISPRLGMWPVLCRVAGACTLA